MCIHSVLLNYVNADTSKGIAVCQVQMDNWTVAGIFLPLLIHFFRVRSPLAHRHFTSLPLPTVSDYLVTSLSPPHTVHPPPTPPTCAAHFFFFLADFSVSTCCCCASAAISANWMR